MATVRFKSAGGGAPTVLLAQAHPIRGNWCRTRLQSFVFQAGAQESLGVRGVTAAPHGSKPAFTEYLQLQARTNESCVAAVSRWPRPSAL